jgi:hypothetical protein
LKLLQIRLNRIEEAENLLQLDLRLQHLGEAVVLYSHLLTTERELMVLTIYRVKRLGREVKSER